MLNLKFMARFTVKENFVRITETKSINLHWARMVAAASGLSRSECKPVPCLRPNISWDDDDEIIDI